MVKFSVLSLTAFAISAAATPANQCMNADKWSRTINLSWWGNANGQYKNGGIWAANAMKSYFSDINHCQEMTAYMTNGNTVVGVWAGSQFQNNGAAYSIITQMYNEIQSNGMENTKYLQYCDSNDPAKTIGIIIDSTNNQNAVRDAIQTWSQGKCWTARTGNRDIPNVTLWVFPYVNRKNGNSVPDPNLNQCKYVRVASGDNLAAKCGVTSDSLYIFNPGVDFTKLQVGQPICCSIGKLPDFRPKPNPDGSCVYHTIQPNENCSTLKALYYPLSEDDLMKYNKNTYGWYGCNYKGHPWVGDKICVSAGTPPRPTPVAGAECGPLAPGDKYNSTCPLNVCCSSSGWCGVDSEHCATKSSPTGAPGTTGCSSNCERKIINNSQPPAEFIKVGYFESWARTRPCLNQPAYMINTTKYTHVHYAFANITSDFKVDVSGDKDFQSFVSLSGVKRIVSFGGWSFSTSPNSFVILREAVKSANMATFINNVFAFVKEHGLDGADFDWEYPGEPDIEGIPPSTAEDATNYLNFIKSYHFFKDPKTSVSIAAPASYWYLKAFPIAEMSNYIDYLVYMTYDFHGQWDYGNKYSQSGCPAGNCLMSHVNMTETVDAMVLITNAGVQANKVIMGIASYGRSFGMSDPNCSGPSCTFTGSRYISTATPGKCTQTAGVLADGEIADIVASGKYDSYKLSTDGSDSWILQYNGNQWVAHLGDQKPYRELSYKWANFGGTVEWAITENGDTSDSYDWSVFIGDEDYLCKNDYSGTMDKMADGGLYCGDFALANALAGTADELAPKIVALVGNYPKVNENAYYYWFADNYKHYFTCKDGPCHEGSTLVWPSNMTDFYNAVWGNFGIPWWMVVKGTTVIDHFAKRCIQQKSQVKQLGTNHHNNTAVDAIEDIPCPPPPSRTALKNYPMIQQPPDGATFNSLFTEHYQPYMADSLTDAYNSWLYGDGYKPLTGSARFKGIGKIRKYFTCTGEVPSHIECSSGTTAATIKPSLYTDFSAAMNMTFTPDNFTIGDWKVDTTSDEGDGTYVLHNAPVLKRNLIPNPAPSKKVTEISGYGNKIRNSLYKEYEDPMYSILASSLVVPALPNLIQSMENVLQVSMQLILSDIQERNQKIASIFDSIIGIMLSFIDGPVGLVYNFVTAIIGVATGDTSPEAILGLAFAGLDSVFTAISKAGKFADAFTDAAKFDSQLVKHGDDVYKTLPMKRKVDDEMDNLSPSAFSVCMKK